MHAFFCVMIFLISSFVSAVPHTANSLSNCVVVVRQSYKSGAQTEDVYEGVEPSKAVCEKKAKPHRVNFDPKHVLRKTVQVKWVKR